MTKKDYYNKHIFHTCSELDITRDDYMLFRRRGATLHRLYEEQCDGYSDYQGNWDEKAEKKSEEKEERIVKLVIEQAKELGLFVYFQTDPRGATIYLDKKPIEVNNYNRSSCIY